MLKPGDLVGLIAPASPLSSDEIARGVRQVESLGLKTRLGAHAGAQNGYLAGADAERAGDFNAMARDREVRAIFALRGGYGTMRILNDLDYAALRNDPKIVLGFSDMTAVLNAVTARSDLVTFHGPVAALSTFDTFESAALRRALMSREPIGTLNSEGITRLHGGRATGPLAGGNLSLVAALSGTPYAIPTDGALLFLEETHEEPYRVDRMLTTLQLAGDFRNAAGVVFGACSHCDASGPALSLEEIYADTIGSAKRPSITGAKIGHITDQWVLPIGIRATLDADAKTLTIAESAVS
jgi:muramoyltetrapeptide carboxypeptidase